MGMPNVKDATFDSAWTEAQSGGRESVKELEQAGKDLLDNEEKTLGEIVSGGGN